VQREDEPATSTGTEGGPGTLTIQLPRPLDLSVNGIGVSGPTLLLEGPTGSRVDINPYTGNKAIDFPLAMLEAMGIPVLSYFYFHHGSARPYLGRRIRHLSGLSGGTSFIRNAIHYGYITADDVDLYGAPSSFNEEHYQGLPNLNIHANPYDIGTMIDFTAFNNPTMDNPNVPTVVFRLSMPFDQNPLEAFKNLGGAVYYMFSGEMYSRPGETHNYPDFRSSSP
jgi:hypothetical protein